MIFKLFRNGWLKIVLRVIVMTLIKDVFKLNRH